MVLDTLLSKRIPFRQILVPNGLREVEFGREGEGAITMFPDSSDGEARGWSSCHVKTHMSRAPPNSPRNCEPHLRLHLERFESSGPALAGSHTDIRSSK